MAFDIKEQLDKLSPEERNLATQILEEFSKAGESKKYEDLIYDDYKEIPVDIHTFLHEKQYLGEALYDAEGRFTLYPYWEEVLGKIFPTNIDTDYHTAIFTGAIGIGKSTVAVIGMIYQLYRILCLKNPQLHYQLQNNDVINFVFVNMTKEMAKGVAYEKFNNIVLQSKWFLERGTVHSTDPLTWEPNSTAVDLFFASRPGMLQGKCIFSCLDGDTLICTQNGIQKIKDCVDKTIRVPSINNSQELIMSEECTVKPTKITNNYFELELEDNSIIKCTPEHRFMLADSNYKMARDLTKDDDLIRCASNNTSYDKVKIIKITEKYSDEPIQFYDVINADPYNNFLIKINNGYICSHNCFCDEVNFSAVATDINKKKKAMKALVSEASNRLQSRFQRGMKNPTVLWLASSKASDQSFLDEFIQNKIKNENETTLIVDKPQWIIKSHMDVPEKFPVAIGGKFMENVLLPKDATEDLVRSYVQRGYRILRVPVTYWGKFAEDLNKALCDIAGLSVAQTASFLSGERIKFCVQQTYLNPFTKEVIEVGNDIDDIAQYSDFFDMSQVPKDMISRPLYMHLDLSLSGDKTGIAGVWIKDKKPSPEGQPQGKDLRFQLAFSVSVKAPKGRQVSFEKTRNFIRWLKNQGFNIRGISSDTYNSASTLQALSAEGFATNVLSVDRVKDNICEPYEFLKQAISEQRVLMFQNDLLIEELVGLKKDNATGKIDHSPDGINSKDQADALCGATYSASKHAEEFAHDYGETWEIAIDVSSTKEENYREKEAAFLYEQEVAKQIEGEIEKDLFMDFGMGPAIPMIDDDDFLFSQGIVIF